MIVLFHKKNSIEIIGINSSIISKVDHQTSRNWKKNFLDSKHVKALKVYFKGENFGFWIFTSFFVKIGNLNQGNSYLNFLGSTSRV